MKPGERKGFKELAVLLGLLAPAGAFFLLGLRSCAAANGFGTPGAAGVAAGLMLALAGGYYHYRVDYVRRGAGGGAGRKAAAFVALSALSALMAVLANRVLFR